MNIAHFINTKEYGGAEAMLINLAKETAKQHNVHIFTYGNDWIAQQCEKHDGIQYHVIPSSIQKNLAIYKLPIFGYQFGKLLNQFNIDILHSHLYGAALRGAAASWFSNIPHLSTMHDVYTIEEKPSRIRWLKWATEFTNTNIITISNTMQGFYTKKDWIDALCVHKVYNGVDINKFSPQKTHSNVFTFIAVGRLEKIKGFDVLVKSFMKAVPPTDKCKLVIVGDGNERGNLETLVTQDYKTKIVFAGTQNNIVEYLRSADVYIQTSRSEGLSCSIIEAMATGLPVIATDVGGNRELISERNGWLAPNEDIKSIASLIGSVYHASTETLHDMVLAGRRKAVGQFSLDAMSSSYDRKYRVLVSK